MPKVYGWEETEHEQNSTGGLFLKMEKGNTYKIRLVGDILSYYQYWKPIVCRSPYKDEETGKVICPLMLSGEEPPKIRFCMWVFDRNNQNKLKIMDFPNTVFSAFKEWRKATGIEPSGPDGPDWSITVEDQKGFTKYICTALVQKPFTEDEQNRINDGNLIERLKEVRKDNTPDEIRAMMAEKGLALRETSSPSATPKQSINTTVKSATPTKVAPKPVSKPISTPSDESLDF